MTPMKIEKGKWPFPNYPLAFLLKGRLFLRAKNKMPYAGVVEQYREAVEKHSAHLKVYEDGHWEIDHYDQYNPDKGLLVSHFFADHPLGKLLKSGVETYLLLRPFL